MDSRSTPERSAGSIILLMLLALRTVGQLAAIVLALGTSFAFVHASFCVAYVTGIVGIAQHRRWGYSVVLGVAAIDALISFITGGIFVFGSILIDVLMLVLAAQELKRAVGQGGPR